MGSNPIVPTIEWIGPVSRAFFLSVSARRPMGHSVFAKRFHPFLSILDF